MCFGVIFDNFLTQFSDCKSMLRLQHLTLSISLVDIQVVGQGLAYQLSPSSRTAVGEELGTWQTVEYNMVRSPWDL